MISARLEVNWNDYRQLIDTMKKAKSGLESFNQKATAKSGASSTGASTEDDPKVQQEIIELQQREKEVIAHEQAHKAVGGQYAGAAYYSYTQGPDGKNYISGGEVTIDVSEEKKPEDTIPKMQQVRAAALAPAQPSPQDMSVASTATQKEVEARIEVLQQQTEAATNKSTEASNETRDPEQSEGTEEPVETDSAQTTETSEASQAQASPSPAAATSTPTPDTGGSAFVGYAAEAYGSSNQTYSAASAALSVFA